MVIADYLDADRLKSDLQTASSRAALLPILNATGKAIETEAMQQYAFLIKPHAMTKFDALAEIDRLMESRSGSRQRRNNPRDSRLMHWIAHPIGGSNRVSCALFRMERFAPGARKRGYQPRAKAPYP